MHIIYCWYEGLLIECLKKKRKLRWKQERTFLNANRMDGVGSMAQNFHREVLDQYVGLKK